MPFITFSIEEAVERGPKGRMRRVRRHGAAQTDPETTAPKPPTPPKAKTEEPQRPVPQNLPQINREPLAPVYQPSNNIYVHVGNSGHQQQGDLGQPLPLTEKQKLQQRFLEAEAEVNRLKNKINKKIRKLESEGYTPIDAISFTKPLQKELEYAQDARKLLLKQYQAANY